jgi:protein-disulfide isomerase
MNKMTWVAGVLVMSAASAVAMGETPAAAPKVSATVPVVVSGTTTSATVPAGDAMKVRVGDRVLGGMMAPVTIIEYASLTCSHCADFATKTFPTVKKEWIDSGKVKYVMRDLPWDNMALGMAKVARCAPEAQFYPLVGSFFEGQERIFKGADPMVEIKNIAKLAGMDDARVETCIRDEKMQAEITAGKDEALQKLGVKGTPAFFVNGTRVEGAQSYDDFKKVLKAEYAKATGK